MKKQTLVRIILSGFALSLLPFSALSSLFVPYHAPELKAPKQLVTGVLTSTNDTVWDYYDIDNGGEFYAVSLKSEIKAQSKTDVEATLAEHGIPSVFPGSEKPVVALWNGAFKECKAESITIPSNIQVIDYEAFFYSSVKDVVIPSTVKLLGEGAFYACPNLETVHFDTGSGGTGSTATTCQNIPCPVPESSQEQAQGAIVHPRRQYQVPANLTIIPSHCFYKCSKLKQIDFPTYLEEVSYEAFNGCTALRSDLFFQNILRIRERAFQGCTALKKVFVSRSLFENANNSGVEPHAFNYCNPELDIYFCGAKSKVEAWVKKHMTWGWFDDRSNPTMTSSNTAWASSQCYSYILLDGNTASDSDWGYTYTETEVTIVSYRGSWEENNSKFISVPNQIDGKDVIRISTGAFSNVAADLERLYLPTTLAIIENKMFDDSFTKLNVIASNLDCACDAGAASIEKRIDLSALTELEFIGTRAFAEMHLRDEIETIHLPGRLRAVGDEAFCIKEAGDGVTVDAKKADYQFTGLKKFLWDYAGDNDSRLECIGNDAFFALGMPAKFDSRGDATVDFSSTDWTHDSGRTLSTIVFPKTLRYFGILDCDRARFRDGSKVDHPFDFKKPNHSRMNRPGHTFALCPLIKTVIFKGSTDSNDTKCSSLIIPIQSFWGNESLQTVVFEERAGKTITFHSQNGNYAQSSIGACGGRMKGDFRGAPELQTIVLPNANTNLRIQRAAFMSNSRSVMYFSGKFWNRDQGGNITGIDKTHIFGNDAPATNQEANQWPKLIDSNGNFYPDWSSKGKGSTEKDCDIDNIAYWKTIGDETFYDAGTDGYLGYCFSNNNATNKCNDDDMNSFGLAQETPVHEYVHYNETFQDASGSTVTVEVGTSDANHKEFKIQDKCAFLCNPNASPKTATMTRYLYDLWDGSSDAELQTARIPSKVTIGQTEYTVNEIGDSAFSACYTDKKDGSSQDLECVKLPDSIEKIGEYAFLRCYALKEITAYTINNGSPVDKAQYTMPSSLLHIGKMAFAFCGLEQCLNIPYSCLFYENEFECYKVPSVFTNSLALRRITFLGEGNNPSTDQTESQYYRTAEYTNKASQPCTVSLYAKDYDEAQGEPTRYNLNRLLLVLNRDVANDKYKETTITDPEEIEPDIEIVKKYQEEVNNKKVDKIRFDGTKWGSEPFLFGAYKMGYWIDSLSLGPCTQDANGNVINTPLISAICTRGANNGDLTVSPIYLNQVASKYKSQKHDTYARSFSSLSDWTGAGVAFAGCTITKVTLPNYPGLVLPDEMFADSAKTEFATDDGASYQGGDGKLDLTNTGYAGIGERTFAGVTSLKHLVVPTTQSGSKFTVGPSAFAGCTSLQTIDFRPVSGTLELDTRAFAGCSDLTNILWPTSGNIVVKNSQDDTQVEIFQGCTALTTLNLNLIATSVLGSTRCFAGCTNLTTVAIVGVGNSPITRISSGSFNGCTKLATFPFDRFDSVESIGANAFRGCFPAANDTVIMLPASVTTLEGGGDDLERGTGCFMNTGIKGVVFSTSNPVSLGKYAFANCTNLSYVRFVNGSCGWNGEDTGSNTGAFSGCTSLTELQLPSGFDLDNQNGSIISGDTAVAIYYYGKYIVGTTSIGGDPQWNKISNTNNVIPCFYASSFQDLLDGSVITGSAGSYAFNAGAAGVVFWTNDGNGGAATILGTIVSCSSDGLVTFSSGATLNP